MQQEFFALLREAKAEGRTVFMSSHILCEVERTADRVAIIRDGRLTKVDRVEALRDMAHHQVELRFIGQVPADEFARLDGVSDVVTDDHVLRMRVAGDITPVVKAAARHELVDFVSREPTLEETFLAEYGPQAGADDVPTADRGHDRAPPLPSRARCAEPRLRAGQRLRQDAARLAPRDTHRGRRWRCS